MSEKYGFVYIWRDRKHNRYYIGSHWGTEDDGYICSSNWMRNAYNRRKNDFKRRIIFKLFDRRELQDKENYFLSMIKQNELCVKYYNVKKHTFNHWSIDEQRRIEIGEKRSKAWTEEARKKQSEKMTGDKNPSKRKEVMEKRKNTIEKNGGLTAWNKGIPMTEEQKATHSINMFNRKNKHCRKGVPLSEEFKDKISSTWLVTHPDGTQEVVHNLNKFCKDNGLTDSLLRKVSYGTRNHHQGFKAMKLDK